MFTFSWSNLNIDCAVFSRKATCEHYWVSQLSTTTIPFVNLPHSLLSTSWHDDTCHPSLPWWSLPPFHLWSCCLHCRLPRAGSCHCNRAGLVSKASPRNSVLNLHVVLTRTLDVMHITTISIVHVLFSLESVQRPWFLYFRIVFFGRIMGLSKRSLYVHCCWSKAILHTHFILTAVYKWFPSCRHSWDDIRWHPSSDHQRSL